MQHFLKYDANMNIILQWQLLIAYCRGTALELLYYRHTIEDIGRVTWLAFVHQSIHPVSYLHLISLIVFALLNIS